jgi:hypothetical protein
MLPSGAGEYVSILQRDWRALPVHVLSRCAYEKRATYGVHIVDETSATGLCDGPVNPIDADHIGIVKPKDAGDLSYIALREAFQGAERSAMSSSPDAVSSPSVTTGALIATRAISVRCGKQTDGTEQISLPVALKPEQRLVDAVVSLQEVTNLKEQNVELTGRTESAASVRYRLVGLDASASGTCAGDGTGTVVVAFLVSQMASPVQNQIRQKTTGDYSPAVAGVGGNVTIVRNAEPNETERSPNERPTLLSPLELATTPALHGILIDQITQGKLSPAITGVKGDVTIRDNASSTQPKRGARR